MLPHKSDWLIAYCDRFISYHHSVITFTVFTRSKVEPKSKFLFGCTDVVKKSWFWSSWTFNLCQTSQDILYIQNKVASLVYHFSHYTLKRNVIIWCWGNYQKGRAFSFTLFFSFHHILSVCLKSRLCLDRSLSWSAFPEEKFERSLLGVKLHYYSDKSWFHY